MEGIVSAYGRFVPHKLLELMGKESVTEVMLGDYLEKRMTILFSDIRDFTTLSESMTPEQGFRFINEYLGRMAAAVVTRVQRRAGTVILLFLAATVGIGADQPRPRGSVTWQASMAFTIG